MTPYIAGMAKTARLDLRLDPDLKARVDAEADRLGQKVTTFVERALESALGGLKPGDTHSVSSPRGSGILEETAPTEHPVPSRASDQGPLDEAPASELEALRNFAGMDHSVPKNPPSSKPKLPAGVKTGAQLAREQQSAARMARLNEGKYGR